MPILRFLNTKGKAFIVLFFSLISLGVLILSTLATVLCQARYGVIVGIVLMLLAVPLHIVGKKNGLGYLISFLLNSIGGGFSLSAYYLAVDTLLTLPDMLFAVLPAAGILFLVYCTLQFFSKTKKFAVSLAVILNLVLLVASVIFWILYGTVWFSFGFFGLLISLCYLCVFGITINHDERSVLRDVSFGSFGSLIILTVVVIFIVSEGDILDGLDFSSDRTGKDEKEKKPKH